MKIKDLPDNQPLTGIRVMLPNGSTGRLTSTWGCGMWVKPLKGKMTPIYDLDELYELEVLDERFF